MDKKQFAFTRTNYILIAAGMAVIILGLLLMSGGKCTEQAFNPDIFNARRIKVAPLITLLGFLEVIFAIVYRPKKVCIKVVD